MSESIEQVVKVEKEEMSPAASAASATKSTTSGDYENRWKAIVQEFAEADGDEFTKENDEKLASGVSTEPAAEDSKPAAAPAAENGGGGDESPATAATEETTMRKVNPEDDELNQFHMPSAAAFLTDMSRYRHQKKLYVHPLTQADIYHDTIVKLTTSAQCVEYRLHFYRDNSEQRTQQGLLTLFFSSNEAMNDATTELQKIREDLVVETHEAKSQKKLMPLWNRKSKESTGAALRDCVLCIFNVPSKTPVEDLKKHFTTAKDIIIPVTYDKGNKTKSKHGYAYAVYETSDEADAACKQYETERPVVLSSTLGVYKYKEGTRKPNGLLSLTQRKLVLKHGAKAASACEKINSGEEIKSQELIKNKLKRCVELIERDNAARRSHNLTTPSYERIIRMKNLPELDSKQTQKILAELRVIPANHVSSPRRGAGYHVASPGGGSGKKQQKRLGKKAPLLRTRQRAGGLLGSMPGYMMSQMAALGYGYGYPHYGGWGAGSNRYSGGYGGYTSGGYYGNGSGAYAGGKGSQASSSGVRPLLETPITRGGYNQGRIGGGYQQQQTGGGRRSGPNQSTNQRMLSGTGHNGIYNGYSNVSNNNRDGRGLYDQYGNSSSVNQSAAAGGDSWWAASGGYNNTPYNF